MGFYKQVDPLLGNNCEISKYTTVVLSNGFSNKHVPTETNEQQQRNGVFCAVRTEMLQTGQLVKFNQCSVVQGSEELAGELVS
jgi:hypothetical protein